MADITNTEFYWDNVVFKVGDMLFRVPRCEFEQSSEVFADMFRLPSGATECTEGQDKEHPIVLQGYRKDEFCCLLKVMYPRAKTVISGTKFELSLEKEEWVSVLKLSTIWNMKQIREYAIHWLSTNGALTPIEKIQLARAHKVATWLEEGLASLVNGVHKLTREELATLGWETSALILWIRDNSSPYPNDSTTIVLSKDMVKCAVCPSLENLTGMDYKCRYCSHIFGKVDQHTVSRTSSGTLVRLSAIRCNSCNTDFFRLGYFNCTACSSRVDTNISSDEPHVQIGEVFGEEIKGYKLAMSVT
ncbi:hypothetical protein BYT27DRAFT_7188391 [Phlegmacium glaucopus]|nr:hypothetical protein BYT27DRAFT_7188391 [Phlegmacium glaucopus]